MINVACEWALFLFISIFALMLLTLLGIVIRNVITGGK
jgi:hypothetical protein